jgi:hypothetical protein
VDSLTFRQFLEILLARLSAADQTAAGAELIDLRELAAELVADIPDAWVWQAAEVMEAEGLANTALTLGGNAHAMITGQGRLFLEDGGRSGILAVYNRAPQAFLRLSDDNAAIEAEAGPTTVNVDASRPSVFLSHAHEDKALAHRIEK